MKKSFIYLILALSAVACGPKALVPAEKGAFETREYRNVFVEAGYSPKEVEAKVNEVIDADMPVTVEYATQSEVKERFDMERLPDDASETVRIVHVGDYDECLCVGAHVEHTAQIGKFRISSTRYQDGVQRIVFRLDLPAESPFLV